MNAGVKNGLIYGVLSIILTLVMYMVNPKLMMDWKVSLLVGFGVSLFFMINAAREEKSLNDGILTYGEALKTTFTVLAVGGILGTIFAYILFNFIDPSLNDMMQQNIVETTESMMKWLGAPEEEIDKAIEKLEENPASFTPGTAALQYIQMLFLGLIYALIVSAFVKKNPTA